MPSQEEHAFRLLTDFDVARYLICNTPGRLDNYEKCQVHKLLCSKFVALCLKCEIDDAWSKSRNSDQRRRSGGIVGEAPYDFVHDNTQKLTSHLDKIGMPAQEGFRPDYETMQITFTKRFYALACEGMRMWKSAEKIEL